MKRESRANEQSVSSEYRTQEVKQRYVLRSQYIFPIPSNPDVCSAIGRELFAIRACDVAEILEEAKILDCLDETIAYLIQNSAVYRICFCTRDAFRNYIPISETSLSETKMAG